MQILFLFQIFSIVTVHTFVSLMLSDTFTGVSGSQSAEPLPHTLSLSVLCFSLVEFSFWSHYVLYLQSKILGVGG